MVKDRLAELQSKVTDRFEDVELGPQTYGAPRSPPPDQFMTRVTQVRSLLDDLKDDIFELKRKQDHILSLPVVQIEHKHELQGHIERIRQKTKTLRPSLGEIEEEVIQFEKVSRSNTEIRLRKNQCDLLRKKMQDVIRLFNDQQIDYKERVSKRVKRGFHLAGEAVSDPEVDRMLHSNSQQIFFREVNPLSIAGRVALEDAASRHAEIVELEDSLKMLQEMFEDMYHLVHEQGEMVDHIQKNTEDATVHVSQAARNTKQAVEYKKSAIRKKWCCVLIVILIIAILVAVAIILGVTLSKK